MLYSERLRELREINNLKQADIGKILEIDKDGYGHYEREYVIIPLKHLNTLCNYYNVSLDYIFNFNNISKYENSIDELDFKLVGERIKEFRKENKITQIKLATILNTAQSVIAKCENGKQLIATPFLYTICKKYNISADYLLGKVDNPKYFQN